MNDKIKNWSDKTGITIGTPVKVCTQIWDHNDNPNESKPLKIRNSGIVDQIIESKFGGLCIIYITKKGDREFYNTSSMDITMIKQYKI
ncbi:MAG: hypothetical protein H8E98_08660 [Bacteroidetes bacterium]|nr:hypothetical protein [Bacteroidota bacterium]